MAQDTNFVFIDDDARGTSTHSFYTTGVAEHWCITNEDEQEDIFTKEDFEVALKKVSRKIKK